MPLFLPWSSTLTHASRLSWHQYLTGASDDSAVTGSDDRFVHWFCLFIPSFKEKDLNDGGSHPVGASGDYQGIDTFVIPCSPSSEHSQSAGAAQGTDYNRSNPARRPQEVAIDTEVEGAVELVIICVYLPSNCCGIAGCCVGATSVGIEEGVCARVCVCVCT
ncbi:hypothetical protein H8959_011759 [Pygathrix nigripes]